MPQITFVVNERRDSEFVPSGDRMPTLVSFQNKGGGPCLIESVDYVITRHLATPKRKDLYGEGPTLSINFKKNHYIKNEKENHFKLILKTPRACQPSDWAALKVAIVEPQWVGNSYVGDLTVWYNHNKQLTLKDVELDVLSKEPSEKTNYK
jgi:hypothetical protein